MGEEVMILILTFMTLSSFTTVAIKALNVWALKQRKSDDQEAELAALRQEVASLKAWTNEASSVILASDSALQQQERRLQSVERHALWSGSPSAGTANVSRTAQPDTEPVEVRTRA